MAGLSKVDLFVNQCIDISIHAQGMSYWDAYYLPIPIRRYFIQRLQKHIEQVNGIEDTTQPLSKTERQKFQQQAKGVSNRNMFSPQK